MKNIHQYNYFRLIVFACFVGILLGAVVIFIRKCWGIDLYAFCSSLVWNIINTVIIIFVLMILDKTGTDTFLLRKKKKT